MNDLKIASNNSEPQKKNRIQVSNTKKSLFFYVNLSKVIYRPSLPVHVFWISIGDFWAILWFYVNGGCSLYIILRWYKDVFLFFGKRVGAVFAFFGSLDITNFWGLNAFVFCSRGLGFCCFNMPKLWQNAGTIYLYRLDCFCLLSFLGAGLVKGKLWGLIFKKWLRMA